MHLLGVPGVRCSPSFTLPLASSQCLRRTFAIANTPNRLDARHLPDMLMSAATYEARVAKKWTAGERFRMYFGGKHGQKVWRGDGVY